jgi:Domain of unknown function (DUF6791)/ThiF family
MGWFLVSHKLISHSRDLKRLRDEGYNLEIRAGHLLVKDVPYVNSRGEVQRGTLVSTLTLAGDVTTRPDDHVAHFMGDYPCHKDGKEIEQIRNQSVGRVLAEGVSIDHTFSAKPKPNDYYEDYYAKVTTYVAILSGPAQAIDATVTARTFSPVVSGEEEETVFNYIDTASSRAEIDVITKRLALGKIAIVGLGGTGSYVLDLVSKTPVKEIHLFDQDAYLQHNAFRSPGAPSIEELATKPRKVVHLKGLYSKMHRGIVAHEVHVDAENAELLRQMDFVFLCLDRGAAKRLIIEKLEEFGVTFIDVGMGVYMGEDALGGILRITTSTTETRELARSRIPFSVGDDHNEYARNIQIADLNALNAALAVIKWKKLYGFYQDYEHENHSTYTIELHQVTKDKLRL